jgi:hypothetical protein
VSGELLASERATAVREIDEHGLHGESILAAYLGGLPLRPRTRALVQTIVNRAKAGRRAPGRDEDGVERMSAANSAFKGDYAPYWAPQRGRGGAHRGEARP